LICFPEWLAKQRAPRIDGTDAKEPVSARPLDQISIGYGLRDEGMKRPPI
jgi:hypothetical protein